MIIRSTILAATAFALTTTLASAASVIVKDDGIFVDFRKEIGPEAVLGVQLIKTKRIPEDGRKHGLPPNDGALPTKLARNVHPRFVAKEWIDRDVVLAPVADTQAMWINFIDPSSYGGFHGAAASYPFALIVATGKVNAIDGKELKLDLRAEPDTKKHNFVVTGTLHEAGLQRWLDGYKTDDSTVRQFVGTGHSSHTSVEEYMTGKLQWGGIQFYVVPMKAESYEKVKAEKARKEAKRARQAAEAAKDGSRAASPRMAAPAEIHVSAGGKIDQVVNFPKYPASDFDTTKAVRFWVTLVEHNAWPVLTGKSAPAPTTDVEKPAAKQSPFADAPGVKKKGAVDQQTKWN